MKKRSFLFLCILVSSLLATPIVSFADSYKIYRLPKSKVKSVKLIIYTRPTVHSRTVKKLSLNTRWIVRLAGIRKYSSHNTWFQVSWNGKTGWMPQKVLIFDAKATNMANKNPKCLNGKTRNKSCEGSI